MYMCECAEAEVYVCVGVPHECTCMSFKATILIHLSSDHMPTHLSFIWNLSRSHIDGN